MKLIEKFFQYLVLSANVCCFYKNEFINLRYETLLVDFIPRKVSFAISITINPKRVNDNFTELKVVAIITKVSNVFNRVDKTFSLFVSHFYFSILMFRVSYHLFKIIL